VVQPQLVAPDAVIQQLIKMIGRLIGEDVSMTVKAASDTGMVMIDKGQLEQVVMNLAVNARDAMPHGGQLSISTCRTQINRAERLATGVLAPGDYVQITVSDAGCGMPPELIERIFEPFFTTKGHGLGTGLGLSTVYAIVTGLKGGIRVDSQVGKGTSFVVLLPRAQGNDESNAEPRQAQLKGGTETILLVEDEEAVASVAQRILSHAGYQVVVARDGAQAIQTLAERGAEISLVLTDVVMPNTNGPDLVEKLRGMRHGLKVLFMSGYTQHAALGGKIREGTEQLLQKPFTSDELLKKIRAVLAVA
jgi:two-component system cell cycle sensor histidine kinase/response regulator CckA